MKAIPLNKLIKHNGRTGALITMHLLKQFGCGIYGGETPEQWADIHAPDYPFIGVRATNGCEVVACGRDADLKSRDQYYNMPEDMLQMVADLIGHVPEIEVPGIGTYNALIREDGIKVGCTKVSWMKFDELVNATKMFRGESKSLEDTVPLEDVVGERPMPADIKKYPLPPLKEGTRWAYMGMGYKCEGYPTFCYLYIQRHGEWRRGSLNPCGDRAAHYVLQVAVK